VGPYYHLPHPVTGGGKRVAMVDLTASSQSWPQFAALLRAHRQAAGLTQKELSGQAGISAAAVRDLEQGRTRWPHPRSVRALVTALGLDAAQAEQLHQAARAGRPGAVETPAALTAEPTATQDVNVGVLGPLAVQVGGVSVAVGGEQPRVLLGRLALSPNTAVHRTELIDTLWGDAVPTSAVNLVQTYVARLRRILQPRRAPGTAQGIVTLDPGGYRLNIGAQQLDLLRFRGLVRDARAAAAARPEVAAERLDQALALWRGDPLADIDRLAGHPLLVAIADERIAAVLQYADLVGVLGSHDRALPGLRELAGRYPLHESLHARLMVALAATGSQAAALTVFDQIQRRLADELGIDASPELLEHRQRVLRQEWAAGRRAARRVRTGSTDPPAAVPAQLPLDVYGFTGRTRELARLDQLLDFAQKDRAALLVCALSGTAGVGKTALAVHWAHRVRDRFPDGQLYVNLRGFDPTGTVMSPAEAIRHFLDALDVPVGRIPTELDAQAALYRSLLSGREMLVLLDNARDADQIRPLLPGAAGCLVVITSRNRLASLVAAEAAQPLPLDVLSLDDARDLLVRRLGGKRVAAEPEALDEIVTLGAHLPLALAILAARAATDPRRSLAALADELRDGSHRLDALTTGDAVTDLRAVFSSSYRTLTPLAARLFRLLGVHPGPDISSFAAASLTALAPSQVRPLLAELTRSHLLIEPTPGRYAFHDLLRSYAVEQADAVDPGADRRAALHRVLDHYLYTAHNAAQRLDPMRDPVELPASQPGVTPLEMVDRDQAFAVLTAEYPVLLAAIGKAAEGRFDVHAWQLSWALATFFYLRGRWHDWAASQRIAVAAAQRLGDRLGQARSHRGLGRAYIGLGRHDDAADQYRSAFDLYGAVGDWSGQAYCCGDLAALLVGQSRYRDALEQAQRAVDLCATVGNVRGQARNLNAVGWCHAQLGEYEQAIDACLQALVLMRETGDRWGEGGTLDSIGFAYYHLGRYERAAMYYRESLDLRRAAGDRYGEAETLTHLGDTHHATGDTVAARCYWRDALVILDELAHPEAAMVRTKLTSPLSADSISRRNT
jgi:DNA-binding SARP family transcriptional activator/tetratricopeptide (TPR) repeat protein/transcriptional regulator with XRE-family HTH domain